MRIGEFWFWAYLLVVGRAFDVWSTRQASADLALELNPVVNYFEMGWGQLILYTVLMIGILLLFYYWALRVRPRVLPDPPVSGFLRFYSFVFLGQRMTRWRLLWAVPLDPRRWLFISGTLAMVVVTIGSFAAGAGNLLFAVGLHPLAQWGLSGWQGNVVIYTIPLVAGLIGYSVYLYHLYRRHAQGRVATSPGRNHHDDMGDESIQ